MILQNTSKPVSYFIFVLWELISSHTVNKGKQRTARIKKFKRIFIIVVSCLLMAAQKFIFRSHEIVTRAFSYVMVYSPTSLLRESGGFSNSEWQRESSVQRLVWGMKKECWRKCCIFRPAFGCFALQRLVEIVIFSIFASKNLKKTRNFSKFAANFSKKQDFDQRLACAAPER